MLNLGSLKKSVRLERSFMPVLLLVDQIFLVDDQKGSANLLMERPSMATLAHTSHHFSTVLYGRVTISDVNNLAGCVQRVWSFIVFAITSYIAYIGNSYSATTVLEIEVPLALWFYFCNTVLALIIHVTCFFTYRWTDHIAISSDIPLRWDPTVSVAKKLNKDIYYSGSNVGLNFCTQARLVM